jgi:hypothetical protein
MALRAPAQPDALQQGLLVYLPMNGDLRDHSSQRLWVGVKGAVELKDGAAHFAGNGSWLELPNVPLDRPFSISMWINPEAAHPAYGLVEQREDDLLNHHFHLLLRGSFQPHLGFYVNDAISPVGIPSSGWTHLVFQFTGAHQQIWINGRLICERAAAPYRGVKGLTRVGRTPHWSNVPAWDFQGLMRELRVYGRALSFTEIGLLHGRATVATVSNSPAAASSNNLLASNATFLPDAAGAHAQSGAVPFLSIERDHLTINGAAGQIYVLQATTNLAMPWEPLALLTNLSGRVEFTDVDARRFEERFYRIQVQQAAGAFRDWINEPPVAK